MAYEHMGDTALEYYPCRYGKSKLLFRGPRRKLDGDYVAVLGGTQTYGKFIEKPYAEMLEESIGKTVVNLGCVNAGTDVFAEDPTVIDICNKARVTVVEVMGAQNMSNRFYAVHPRRNDRFLRASTLLKTIYREVDFTDFSFTRHMLSTLAEVSPEKFAMVRQELKDAWVARMQTMLAKIESRVVILWMADHSPDHPDAAHAFGSDPLFVDRQMIEAIRPLTAGIVEVTANPKEINAGLDRMVFNELEAPVAREMLGPVVHGQVTRALAGPLAELVRRR